MIVKLRLGSGQKIRRQGVRNRRAAITAAALLTALPPLLVYFVSGRYFVRGITAGAVKG